jgi:hypothetical protein
MKFKEYIGKAIDIQNSSAAWYRQQTDVITEELSKIRNDRHLSPEGKAAKTAEINGVKSMELLKAAHARKREYLQHLSDAKKDAKLTFKSAVKRPADDEAVSEFAQSVKRLKTELMLSTRYETSKEKLEAVVGQISDPFFAQVLADEFSILIPSMLATAENPSKARLELNAIYQSLSTDFLPYEAKAAHEALQYIEAAEKGTKIYPEVAVSHANVLLGGAGRYLNDEEAYEQMLSNL